MDPKSSTSTTHDTDSKSSNEVKAQQLSSVTSSDSIHSSSKISKPSTIASNDKTRHTIPHSSSYSLRPDDLSPSSQMKPWSKLKLATVVSTGSGYTSLNNSLNEGSPVRSQSIKIAKIKPTVSADERNDSHAFGESSGIVPPIRTPVKPIKHDTLKVKPIERISTSDSEIKSSEIAPLKAKSKSRACKIHREPKNYRSVDDLSPEYGGLPFVKRLKILNERQKLAELESVMMQTRSVSLDYPDSSIDSDLLEPLIRSHSEGSGMTRPKIYTIVTPATTAPAIVPIAPMNMPQCLQSPVSPEANETMERRHLKSILKKLSEERNTVSATMVAVEMASDQDSRSLLAAPTVEGYVARHSKLMKSVTFNSTLSSPPASAHSAADATENQNRSHFPMLNAHDSNNPIDTTQLVANASVAINTSVPPSSPQSQSDNAFLIDDSTNRLYAADHPNITTSNKYEQLTTDKSVDSNTFLSKKFVKGNCYLIVLLIYFWEYSLHFLFVFFLFESMLSLLSNEYNCS